MGRGWEYVLERDLVGNAPQVGRGGGAEAHRQAGRRRAATTSCCIRRTSGSRSTSRSAHPTELDRAMGYEANYAGTSFVAPPEKMLGKLRYGPEFMNIQGDRIAGRRARHHRLGRRGREARRVPHHQERDRQRLPDHPRAGALARVVVQEAGQPTRSHGCSYADSWDSVQFQRMPNVSLLPGEKDAGVGGPHRRHRPRHRDHRRRLVLDRPAALQRAVRRPGVLRDQGRQDRRHAQGRRLPDAHARLLELDGHDRRQVELRARRSFFDGKGQPGQIERGQPRLRRRRASATSTSSTPGGRHEPPPGAFSTRRSGRPRPTIACSRESAQALFERVSEAVEGRRRSRCSVEQRLHRQHPLRREPDVDRRAASPTRSSPCRAPSGRSTRWSPRTISRDESLRARGARSREALAKLAPDDPEAMPRARAAAVRDGERVLRLHGQPHRGRSREGGAHGARAGAQRGRSSRPPGFLITGDGVGASATEGIVRVSSLHERQLPAHRAHDGRHGIGLGRSRSSRLDAARLQGASRDRAIEKARLSRNPVAIEPGRYTVILEPQAVGDLVQLIGNYADARSADEGRSPFVKPGGGNKDR